VNIQLM